MGVWRGMTRLSLQGLVLRCLRVPLAASPGPGETSVAAEAYLPSPASALWPVTLCLTQPPSCRVQHKWFNDFQGGLC